METVHLVDSNGLKAVYNKIKQETAQSPIVVKSMTEIDAIKTSDLSENKEVILQY